MISEQLVLNSGEVYEEGFSFQPDLILLFVSTSFSDIESLNFLRVLYPDSVIIGSSTAGEIEDINIYDGSAVATAVKFEKATLDYHEAVIHDPSNSFKAAYELIEKFDTRGLKHVMVFCDGLQSNPSEFVEGLRHKSDVNCTISGGFAADGFEFINSYVITNDVEAKSKMAVAVGFYGEGLKIGYGSLSGWDSFGVDRIVTRSENNKVYSIDGMPILELYKNMLQEQFKNLPASGMLLPISVRKKITDRPEIRSIVDYDSEKAYISFCGNIPEGSILRLMKANHERLVSGAEGAAELGIEEIGNTHTDLAILISSVGRRLVLKQLDEDEIVAVRDVIGEDATIAGYYSYSEIAPHLSDKKPELQCQSMTITTFSEFDPEDEID
jgi:hypothetical protein